MTYDQRSSVLFLRDSVQVEAKLLPVGILLMRHLCCYWWFRDPNKFENGRTTTQKWPKYSTDDREVIVLDAIATDAHLQSQAGLRDGHCKFWSETVPALLTATSKLHISHDASFRIHSRQAVYISIGNGNLVYWQLLKRAANAKCAVPAYSKILKYNIKFCILVHVQL